MKKHTSAASSSAREAADRRPSDVRDERRDFARAARFYLQLNPRQLPSRFLYDALGSALFDAICHLPWYRITRAELQLLQRHAATIGQVFRDGGRVVELGCGNGEKLATLLTHADVPGVHAHLIDLSEAALARSVQTLAAIEGLDIRVTTHQATYEDGLLALPDRGCASDARRLPRLEYRELRPAGRGRLSRPDTRRPSAAAITCCSARISSSRNANCCSRTTIHWA